MSSIMKIPNMLTEKFISWYFLVTALNACLKMMGMDKLAKFNDLILYAVVLVALCLFVKKIDVFKILFLLFGSVLIYTSLLETYPQMCLINALKSQMYVMLFFFIGKEYPNICNKVFNRGFFPFLVTCMAAVYLYIAKPWWYMVMKLNNTNTAWTDGYILEMSRLSGFWPFPYWISYGAALFFAYLMVEGFFKYSFNKRLVTVLVFLLVIMFLAQQRAPLFFSVGVMCFFGILSLYSKKTRTNKFRFYMIFLVVSILIAIHFVTQYMESDLLERMIAKIEKANEISEFVAGRADIFYFFSSKNITFFGDGLGRYSHVALYLGLPAITDQQYLKIIYESGVWGCLGYGSIIAYSFYRGLKKMQENVFALLVIAMYIISMFGANCLAVTEEHPAIFWLCCGSIFATKESYSDRGRFSIERVLKL